MKFKTLRIKKKFFKEIEVGIKNIEYRDYREYYVNMFITSPEYIILHYQSLEKLIVKIKKIELIKKPKILKNSKINFGNKVFKIQLGKRELSLKTIPEIKKIYDNT